MRRNAKNWSVNHQESLSGASERKVIVIEELIWRRAKQRGECRVLEERGESGLRIEVGVTDPIRRHPVLIAQAMLTLAHLTRRRPILGIGAGERENIEPYGLDFSEPVGRLEEALQIILLVL